MDSPTDPPAQGGLPTDAPPWAGRNILVCGVGVAGAPAARALVGLGATVSVTDTGAVAQVHALTRLGARDAGPLTSCPDDIDLVVTSPGWRPTNPVLRDAAAKGIEVIGEVELAWRLRTPGAAPWLAITGTNGKTTTVHMLEAILKAAGYRALAVGNVGISIIDAVTAEPPYDVLAVELSSFQLHWSSTIAPLAGAWLNLAPDHLDWHGDLQAYAEAKARVWAGDVAIGNLDDDAVAKALAQLAHPDGTRIVGFTVGRPPSSGGFGVIAGRLTDTSGAQSVDLIAAADVRPAGAHNVSNALAASALARAFGVNAGSVERGLRAFEPDPHRNQLIAEPVSGPYEGVRFVDDSKATNPHAAQRSLETYESVVWIAGGQLKDAPVDELVAGIAGRLRGVVLLGVDRGVLAAALARHAPQIPVIEVPSTDDGAMTSAVGAALSIAAPGDTVLLAPAAASLDMFTSYAARGTAFSSAVRAALAATPGTDRPSPDVGDGQ
jgi:UDP-N-acetylmuramoylalanine--D-glutamate ligase